ncbi:hypothetical protein SmB9_02790 [Sphingosinicella microcystinivorans]|uniref:Uncharacterized protein YegP (UPF0339 family) n=1 Tax=Sphingosinicella microcystinivorans TaxID=335406 RepID=A0AAD1FZL7_SPHMI|nr:uncharacterized protein YegP (UPF0339 family) [Sphingosinicella microcystinivorans]BBE32621.1 hypothetical protein SmB9_02790 [Sphingosinicella microcystinivorans]
MLSIVKCETHSLSSFAGLDPAPVCYFEMYCGDEKRLTPAIHRGEDWSWRFCAPNGAIMAKASGYRSEAECRAAIDMLRSSAAGAKIREALQYA